VPVVVIPPGFLVNVQVPDEGKLLNTTLPVDKVQVGCVMVPTDGATGTLFTIKEDEFEPVNTGLDDTILKR